MPRHLQFNPHIRDGYRPLMTPAECLRSIFRLHNETVNILTHGFAIVYILVTVPYLLPWGKHGTLAGFLSWCHLIGAVSPWIGSFLYHVFMNLNYGETVYRCLLKLDMLGIWICQSIEIFLKRGHETFAIRRSFNQSTTHPDIKNKSLSYFQRLNDEYLRCLTVAGIFQQHENTTAMNYVLLTIFPCLMLNQENRALLEKN